MEEHDELPSQAPTAPPASRVKVGCLSAATSFQQSYRYVKAFLIAQLKKLSAKSEAEAAEADLLTAKMQVEAADDAENTKKQLHNKYS